MPSPPPPKSTTPLSPTPIRPEPTALQGVQMHEESQGHAPSTRRKHRGKKKRARRQSFLAPSDDGAGMPEISEERVQTASATRESFYRLHGRNASNTSVDSEALLDHREQQSLKPRKTSTMGQSSGYGPNIYSSPTTYRNPFVSQESFRPPSSRLKMTRSGHSSDDDGEEQDERAPLISTSARSKSSSTVLGYGQYGGDANEGPSFIQRRSSSRSSKSSRKKTIFDKQSLPFPSQTDYNVNYPPSVPGSPEPEESRRDRSYRDMMSQGEFNPGRSSPRGNLADEYAIDIESHSADEPGSMGETRRRSSTFDAGRRHTIALQAEEDVCFPIEGMSELAEEDFSQRQGGEYRIDGGASRRRRHVWPDLSMLDEWSRFEKDGRSEERRTKKIIEPELVAGRLRPVHRGWHRAEDDAPYRFTYFNEEFQSTIHSQAISELIQPGQSFRELFIPDPPELSDSESEDDEVLQPESTFLHHPPGINGDSRAPTRESSLIDPLNRGTKPAGSVFSDKPDSKENSGEHTPSGVKSPEARKKPKRYGERPTWWLDVLSPTEAEMKVISKTFGIHPLTAEDIMMQEAREKVELFRNYYFVNYRTFEQDMNSEDFLEPVNMYVVVFREGVLSFHFSLTPHPANVRRRIRQLKDYLILSSDWISYAIIDDITDVFAPLIQNIEDEVDDIDDAILRLHSPGSDVRDTSRRNNKDNEKRSESGDVTTGESDADMLRRVGDCRKKVMGLYRLLGNKADVIKGFAKRCNEHWEVAPRSEIGLYLGDIQDHIVTMTGNLSHYEKILARSHGNYLAQINIRMNERQEQTADVLGKLTVLGTIVLPMNIITGLWGMNVWVPGQEHEGSLTWFWCITAGLLVFGLACFFIAKTLYRIV